MIETATAIVQRLKQAGHTAYFAGGIVRDMLRGVPPHDIDIATTAPPEDVQRLFPRTVAVGAQFGVVLVREGDHPFEVATFRSDDVYRDGRHPVAVRYGTPQDDARRRDFTINGLFYDPLTRETIDYVQGRADIERRLVRAIDDPRRRFAEDKLRLLRCVRFASTLGYDIEPATFDAVREMAGQIQVVSAERIRDELVRMFTRPHAGRGLSLLDESGLLAVILPEVAAMKGVEQPPQFHPEGDVFTHTRLMMDRLALDRPETEAVLALAVLLHDVGKPPTFARGPDRIRFNDHDQVGARMAEDILRRLRFPNDTIDQVARCVREHMRFQHAPEMRSSKLKRMLARETFPLELELHRIDCLSSHGRLDNYEFLRAKAAELPEEIIRPARLVTGRDLLDLGFPAGPLLGKVLREVEELQLEERLQTRDDALAYARDRLAGPPSDPSVT